MPQNVANGCVTMDMVLDRSAKMAADPNLESEELCLLGKWTMVETALGVAGSSVSENIVSFL